MLWSLRLASVVEYPEVVLSVVCDVGSVLFDGRLVTDEDSVEDGTLVVVFAAVEDPVISVIVEGSVDS